MAVGYVSSHTPVSVKEAKRTCGPCDAEYDEWRKFSEDEVAKHCTLNDGWIIVFDRVYDITTFAVTHPGFHNAGACGAVWCVTGSRLVVVVVGGKGLDVAKPPHEGGMYAGALSPFIFSPFL